MLQLPQMLHPGAWPQAVFFLHPTFHNPVREVLQHPFEIEEYGWGEFELSVVVRPWVDLATPVLAVRHNTPWHA